MDRMDSRHRQLLCPKEINGKYVHFEKKIMYFYDLGSDLKKCPLMI